MQELRKQDFSQPHKLKFTKILQLHKRTPKTANIQSVIGWVGPGLAPLMIIPTQNNNFFPFVRYLMKLQTKAITHVLAFIATWVVGLFISLANDTKNKLMVYSYAEMLLCIYISSMSISHLPGFFYQVRSRNLPIPKFRGRTRG